LGNKEWTTPKRQNIPKGGYEPMY